MSSQDKRLFKRPIWHLAELNVPKSLMVLLFTCAAFNSMHSVAADWEQAARALSQESRSIDQRREALQQASLEERQVAWEASKAKLEQAEAERIRLKTQFEENEVRLAELQERLRLRSGNLGQVAGVVREASSDLKPLLKNGLIAAEYSRLPDALMLNPEQHLPRLEDLHRLNAALIAALQASGEQSRFETELADDKGQLQLTPVLRLGLFNAVDENGHYLIWDSAIQRLQRLVTQPDRKIVQQAKAYFDHRNNALYLDPGRGETLALIGQHPSLLERFQQGGSVAYVIAAIAGIGLLLALILLVNLLRAEAAVKRQLRDIEHPRQDNALGNLLNYVAKESQGFTVAESWETRLDEALLQTQPKLERGQTFIKLLAAVAPLLGLLGTVVGMIATFQSITLFGTGDPQVMAGGISQALVTTVLGLLAAIPLLFSHNILSTRSRRLLLLIQEKALACMLLRQQTLRQSDPALWVGSEAVETVAEPAHA